MKKTRIMYLIGLLFFLTWLAVTFIRYCYYYLGNRLLLFDRFDYWGFSYLSVDYSNGLVSRGLPGEVLKKIISDKCDLIYGITLLKVVYLGLVMLMLGAFVIAVCVFRDAPTAMISLIIFARPLYLVSFVYQIRNDNVWYLCLIVILVLMLGKAKTNYGMILWWSVLIILSTVAMLCHHGFIFVFAPLICAIIYSKYSYKQMMVYLVIMIVEFILLNSVFHGDVNYIVTHSKPFFDNYLLYTGRHEDALERALTEEYGYSKWGQISRLGMNRYYFDVNVPKLLRLIPYSISSTLITVQIIYSYICNRLRERILLFPLFIIPFILLLAFTIDCDRWFLMTLTSINIFAFYLVAGRKVEIMISKSRFALYLITVIGLIELPFFMFY